MTPEELWRIYLEEDHEEISEEITDVDDHGGADITLILKLPDGRYFRVSYHNSRGGDYNSWRDGELSDYDVEQVEPHEETITRTVWKRVKT